MYLYLNRASSLGLARRIMLGSDWLLALKAPDWSVLVPLLVPFAPTTPPAAAAAEGEPHPALKKVNE